MDDTSLRCDGHAAPGRSETALHTQSGLIRCPCLLASLWRGRCKQPLFAAAEECVPRRSVHGINVKVAARAVGAHHGVSVLGEQRSAEREGGGGGTMNTAPTAS